MQPDTYKWTCISFKKASQHNTVQKNQSTEGLSNQQACKNTKLNFDADAANKGHDFGLSCLMQILQRVSCYCTSEELHNEDQEHSMYFIQDL